MLNCFERYASGPRTESEYIARDEARARFEEARERDLDNAWEYERENWVEAREFTGQKPPTQQRMQMELEFGEVA